MEHLKISKKKVYVVGTVGLPAKYGGFETLAEYLVDFLGAKYDFTVFCSSLNYNEFPTQYNGAHLEYLSFSANGIQSIAYDIISLMRSMKKADIILVLGVSGGIFLPFVRLFGKGKIITNIDGIEWRRGKWFFFAKKFLKFSERISVKFSHNIITDNMGISDYVQNEYKIKPSMIPYGGNHVKKLKIHNEIKDYYFSVCRIEPENNIHIILESFSRLDRNLIFVGNWQNSKYGSDLYSEFNSFDNIQCLDPIYDQKELDKLRYNCKCYIHGHSAGGTNPSLVEAMSLGLNILAFDCVFNRNTTFNEAKYFSGIDDLINVLSTKKINNGVEMSKIAEDNYTWEMISKSYENLFEGLDIKS